MSKRMKISVLVGLLVSMMLVSVPVKADPQFVISTIGDLDEYGQGISPGGIDILENSTGSWLFAQPFGGVPSPFNWTAGLVMQVRLETRLNSTLTGAVSLEDGKNYFKHNVTVAYLDTVVFSQQNFTYRSSADVSGIYYYSYEVILNFLPEQGRVYTITIIYEVFY